MKLQGLQLSLFVLGFALAYFLAAKVGIATSLPPQGIVIVWPPNAIVLATLLLVKREKWWLFFTATVATEIAADVPDYPLWAAFGYGVVNFSEAALAAVLLTKLSRNGLPLQGLRTFIRFVAIGPLFASGTAALFGAAIYKLGAPDVDYLHYWRVFWLGDALGLLIVGTTLLAWRAPPVAPRLTGRAIAEGVLLALGLCATSYLAFMTDADTPLVYLIFPFLVWAALRFGVRGASSAVVAVVAVAIWSAIMGYGPFAALTQIDSVIALQGLIAVVALSTFMLAFANRDSMLAYQELGQINENLDRIVADRTRELGETVARNELLLKELHHRVKNNLQLVSSLLALHRRSVSSLAMRDRFSDVQGQINAVAATYDIMQKLQTADLVDLCHVVPPLCQKIGSAGGKPISVKTEVSGEAFVSPDAAIALALALNELITNSIKRATADGIVTVLVTCKRDGDNVLLNIEDNGPGFPPGFDIDRTKGFGMRMVRTVVGQANGSFRLVESQSGATIEISVPLAAEATYALPPPAPN